MRNPSSLDNVMVEMDSQLIEAVTNLLELLFQKLGVWGTVALFAGITIGMGVRAWYRDRQAREGWKTALDEKDRTIQRLAEQEREWRIYFVMRDMGMGRQEAQKLIERNEFANPEQAREKLEKEGRVRKRGGRGRRG